MGDFENRRAAAFLAVSTGGPQRFCKNRVVPQLKRPFAARHQPEGGLSQPWRALKRRLVLLIT